LWIVVTALASGSVVIVWAGVRPGEAAPPSVEPDRASVPPWHRSGLPPWHTGTVVAEPPRLLRDPRLRLLCGLGLMAGLTAHMTHGMFQIIAVEVAGLSAAQIGLIYSASVAVLLVVGPLAGWLSDRRGPGPLAGARGIANAVSSLTYLVSPTMAGMLAGRMVDDTGKAAFRPTWATHLAQASTTAGPRAGRVTANLDSALSVGEAVGPLLAALLWDVWGLAAFLLTRAALGVGTELVLSRRLRVLDRAGGT
ncbi:MFS transporter, partial [Actinokineospora sp.]|uniref:MFS transporter n=1 Tax=Actinokineospora sp. TaxID=1872133 RepID=UPI003D6BF1AC